MSRTGLPNNVAAAITVAAGGIVEQRSREQSFRDDAKLVFAEFACSRDNPCGGCVQYNLGEPLPWQVCFRDGCVENFGTRRKALSAIRKYVRDERQQR